jgi:integrase
VTLEPSNAHHLLLDGRLHLYKRGTSRYWQCSAYLAGKDRRISTKEESFARAKDVAEDWYLGLRGKLKTGELKSGKTFREVAEQYKLEYGVITQGQRNVDYVEGHWRRLRLHLLPFFGPMVVSEITPGKVQEYRIHRMRKPEPDELLPPAAGGPAPREWKPPARGTLHQEIVVLRQVLQTAQRHQWLVAVPDLSPPYKTSGKVTHRAWFSPTEYQQLYEATRRRAKNPIRERWRHECEDLHDYVLFMANTGLRPDEAARLEYRDVTIEEDEATQETILLIEVRGKRGLGLCKSTAGAIRPFDRLRKRNKPQPNDRVFPKTHRELFNAILNELGLKLDREGNRRTAYSLRHTYICLRLMEGADIYQIAKNCRTSVEMIEKYYAVHLKTTLDAAAINVRRPRHKPPRGRRLKTKRKHPKQAPA